MKHRMARVGRPSRSLIHTGFLLAIVLLPEFLGAVPVQEHREEEVPAVPADGETLVRNRRNIPVFAVPQFKRVPDFWGWYKHFVDSHNQEGAAAPEPAPAKVPAPILTPMLPMPLKSPTGFYYYAPVLEPFLSAGQRSELLRICPPEDVECLQYHLRAAYGYRPAPGPAPSYAALKCDPKDPYCMPTLVHKAPTGYYHLLYPSCDPAVDPLCVTNVAAPAPLAAEEAPKEQHCNPLFDAGCNPLTATKMSGLTKPVLEYAPNDQPAAPAAPLSCDPRVDPFCILAAAAALRKPAPQLPEHQVRYKLGVRGKTKEGYDCYVHYDKDCTPVKSGSEAKAAIKAPAKPLCHPFDPSCGKFASPSEVVAPKPGKDGIILPDPDCDPEFDYNCRLRRAEPAADEPAVAEEEAADEPAKEAAVPRFEDFLRGIMSQHK